MGARGFEPRSGGFLCKVDIVKCTTSLQLEPLILARLDYAPLVKSKKEMLFIYF